MHVHCLRQEKAPDQEKVARGASTMQRAGRRFLDTCLPIVLPMQAFVREVGVAQWSMPSAHIQQVRHFQDALRVAPSQIVCTTQAILLSIEIRKLHQMRSAQSVVRALLMHLGRCVAVRRAKYRFRFLVETHSLLVRRWGESAAKGVCWQK